MSLARHSVYNLTTVGLNAASALLVSVVAARSLGPEAMGMYAWLAWLLAMAAIAVNLGGVTTTLKHLAEACGRGDREEAAGVLAHGLRRWGRNIAAVTVLWLIAGIPCAHAGPVSWLLAAFALAPTTLFTFLSGACQGLGRYDRVALATGTWATVQLVGVALAAVSGTGVPGLLLAQGLAQAAGCAVLLGTLRTWRAGWRHVNLSTEVQQALGAYAGPVALVVLLDAIVWQRSGVFFLERWAAPAEVACFALAFALAQMAMRAAPGTLVGLLLPTMARARGAGDLPAVSAMYRRAGRWMAMLALPVAMVGAWEASQIVAWLYGEAYAAAAPPLALLLAAGAASMSLGFPASSVLYALDGQRGLLRVGFLGACLYVTAAFWLIPGGGAWEAALVTCLAQAFCLGAGIFQAARLLGGTWPDGRHLGLTLGLTVSMAAPLAACEALLPPVVSLVTGASLALLWFATAAWALGLVPAEDRAAVARRLPKRPRTV